jgi:hypothetical protein
MAEWTCADRRIFHGCLCHISLAKKKQKNPPQQITGEGYFSLQKSLTHSKSQPENRTPFSGEPKKALRSILMFDPQKPASAPATNLPREA